MTTNSSKRGLLTAISRFTGGFPLPVGDANGQCSPSSLSPLRFGFNATSTCSVPLTLAQLQNYCVSNSSLPELNLQHVLGGFYTQLKNNNVYVGIWGNSNWTTPQEWIPVVQTKSSFSNLVWQNGRSCLNVVVGYDVQILTGLAFAANNAQQKVLYVNVCYRTATWSFPTTADPSQPQRFFMTSTVSVVPLDQSPYGVKKPAPPLATPLPEEIFYPFVTSGSKRVVSSLGLGALAMLAAIVSIFTYYF